MKNKVNKDEAPKGYYAILSENGQLCETDCDAFKECNECEEKGGCFKNGVLEFNCFGYDALGNKSREDGQDVVFKLKGIALPRKTTPPPPPAPPKQDTQEKRQQNTIRLIKWIIDDYDKNHASANDTIIGIRRKLEEYYD